MDDTAPLADDCDPTYTHFAHRAQFIALLDRFLALDLCHESGETEEEAEVGLVDEMGEILDYYLPLPGLLDPSLHEVVPPLMTLLENSLRILDGQLDNDTVTVSGKRLERVGRVVNWVVKVRGWKAVVPYFPSSIPNLPLIISILSPHPSSASSTQHHPLLSSSSAWELRSVLLLWFALLLTVPFNLSALSDGDDPVDSKPYGLDLSSATILFTSRTSDLAQRVTLIAAPLLHKPGREGAYAALLLARLFSRTDGVQGLRGFFAYALRELQESDREEEVHLVSSLFHLIALLPSMLPQGHLEQAETFLAQMFDHLRGGRTVVESGLVRKLAVKAKGRLWVTKIGRKREEGDQDDLPEGLEEVLDEFMGGLSDKDTIVRYSSAKYLSRLSNLLPPDLSDQIVGATIALFSGTEDEPAIFSSCGGIIDPGGSPHTGGTFALSGGIETSRGESRWHGVCLALGEMARRGLVHSEQVGEAVEWVLRGLTFDIRRASHSIGTNVRDAAAYVLWSLSRTCAPALLQPCSSQISAALVNTACFDREVGVRRAASAAFQEGVGRLGQGVYPEGIDVLGKMDFWGVSVRRRAFGVAAPAVGIHKVYREYMIDHLHNVTLRHWDVAMRIIGAEALKCLVELDISRLDQSLDREIKELSGLDPINVHGALSALSSLSSLFPASDPRSHKIFTSLSSIRAPTFLSTQAPDILISLYSLLTTILSPEVLEGEGGKGRDKLGKWLDMAGRRREVGVHEGGANVWGVLSGMGESTRDVEKLMTDLKSSRATIRQYATLSLGHIQHPSSTSPLASTTQKAVKALLGLLKEDQRSKVDVESRKWAVRSLGDIGAQRRGGIVVVKYDTFHEITSALITSLQDYSTDQRGDVGSWVRIASLNSLGLVLSSLAPQDSLLTEELRDKALAGILKQAMEKLESCRGAAALALARLRQAGWHWLADSSFHSPADMNVEKLMEGSFRYVDQREWFASGMGLLGEEKWRRDVLEGLVLTVGSQVGSLASTAFDPLLDYLTAHPATIVPTLSTLSSILSTNFTSNRVFIPTLQTFWKLISTPGIWTLVANNEEEVVTVVQAVLALATKGSASIKSIERISVAMRLVIASLSGPKLVRSKAVGLLSLYLNHRFPRIRAITSEELYLALSQAEDGEELDEELEEILLETEWVATTAAEDGVNLGERAEKVVELLRASS
ncbi:hypothetical protein B9479_007714 [Cryptococcus floricola]|uniref:Uncharacterized protein n=1 Tax=Cryptococcus floricola TaxID=2591691 RepID=A0A5D3AMS5_9TREE|nr:hypothetical protein B9479_007714 [Cryptococcus floricola]